MFLKPTLKQLASFVFIFHIPELNSKPTSTKVLKYDFPFSRGENSVMNSLPYVIFGAISIR